MELCTFLICRRAAVHGQSRRAFFRFGGGALLRGDHSYCTYVLGSPCLQILTTGASCGQRNGGRRKGIWKRSLHRKLRRARVDIGEDGDPARLQDWILHAYSPLGCF